MLFSQNLLSKYEGLFNPRLMINKNIKDIYHLFSVVSVFIVLQFPNPNHVFFLPHTVRVFSSVPRTVACQAPLSMELFWQEY